MRDAVLGTLKGDILPNVFDIIKTPAFHVFLLCRKPTRPSTGSSCKPDLSLFVHPQIGSCLETLAHRHPHVVEDAATVTASVD